MKVTLEIGLELRGTRALRPCRPIWQLHQDYPRQNAE